MARRDGVRLEQASSNLNLDKIALRGDERVPELLRKHGMLLVVGAYYRNLRSSMLVAIERGRPPAVDFLNGEIVARGQKYGVPTPVNAAAQATVHAIARCEKRAAYDTLRAMARELGVQ